MLCSDLQPALAEGSSEGSAASNLEGTADASCYVVHLADGQTRDITNEERCTRLVIDEIGTYYLEGKSSQCYLDIVGGENVTVVLCDGLNLAPGVFANAGKQVAGINVEDFEGTVTIKTAKNGVAKVSGYSGECGIRKVGTKGELVFATEDPDAPGTLIANGSYRAWASAPAVGRLTGATGNIYFESGNIEVTGGKGNAPGIGIGGMAHYSDSCSYAGSASEDVSSSGAFSAEANGLLLGGGLCDGIYINGGNIKAQGGTLGGLDSYGGAGIGGGTSPVKNLVINGGYIVATPGKGNIMIGGAGQGRENWGSCTVAINGGTITHEKSDSDHIVIGSLSDNVSSIVTGGTIRANEIEEAINGHKAKVVRSKAILQDQDSGEAIESLVVTGLDNLRYGLKDVETLDEGALYLWLPEGTAEKPVIITMAVVADEEHGDIFFGGEVKTGTDGTLCRATPIKIVGNGEGAADGTACKI